MLGRSLFPFLLLSCAKGAASHALEEGSGGDSQRGGGLLLVQHQDHNNDHKNNEALLSFCDTLGEICYKQVALVHPVLSPELSQEQTDDHYEQEDQTALIVYEWMASDSEWVRLVLVPTDDDDDDDTLCGCGGTQQQLPNQQEEEEVQNKPMSVTSGALLVEKNQDENLLQIMMSSQDDGGTGEQEERQLEGVGKKTSAGKKQSAPATGKKSAPAVGKKNALGRAEECVTCCGGTTQNVRTEDCALPYLCSSYVSGISLVCYIATSYCSNFKAIEKIPFTGCSLPKRRQRELGDDDGDSEDEGKNDNKTEVMNPPIMMPKHKSALAFVRVPKTGSTTMLQNLFQTPDLYSWLDHLPAMPLFNKQNKKQGSAMMLAASCVYGSVPTTAHLGANFFHQEEGWRAQDEKLGGCLSAPGSVGSPGGGGGGGWNACPHIPYPKLVKQWRKTLDYWEPPETAVFEQGAVPGNFSFGLRAFSIVRDPFDRLVSYFEYLGRFVNTNQFLKHTVTDEQYQRVQAGDLYGWMELLYEQGGGRGLLLPFQHRYFHDDLDTAISLIQQDEETGAAPKIFVVLTECYEPSLRLLAEHFDEFKAESVDTFVASPEYKSNQNKKSITNSASYLKDQDTQGLESLRELAQEWFKDDFVFYDVAVKQFQTYMEKSLLDPIHFESCAHWKGAGSNAAQV